MTAMAQVRIHPDEVCGLTTDAGDALIAPALVANLDMVRRCARICRLPAILVIVDRTGQEVRAAGAGFSVVSVDAHPWSLDEVLEGVRGGLQLWPPTGNLLVRPGPDGLPRIALREADVLDLLLRGFPPSVVAQRLVVSPETVKTHAGALLRKFNVSDRSGLVCRVFGYVTDGARQ